MHVQRRAHGQDAVCRLPAGENRCVPGNGREQLVLWGVRSQSGNEQKRYIPVVLQSLLSCRGTAGAPWFARTNSRGAW